MRKFKHKPSGKILEVQKLGHNKVQGFKWGDWEIPLWVVNNSSDWEEAVEKDYEVLSFIANKKHGKEGHIVFIKDGKSTIGSNNVQDYIDDVDDWWDIHSIKRLSDGEIFQLGDKVSSYKGTITSFSLDSHNDNREVPWLVMNNGLGGIALNYAKKVENFLFTTEDGVDIYEVDEFWFINKSSLGSIMSCKNYVNDSRVYYFSSKQKAEEYILWNKPVLSLREVASVYPGINKLHPDMPSHQAEVIKKMVKQKL